MERFEEWYSKKTGVPVKRIEEEILIAQSLSEEVKVILKQKRVSKKFCLELVNLSHEEQLEAALNYKRPRATTEEKIINCLNELWNLSVKYGDEALIETVDEFIKKVAK